MFFIVNTTKSDIKIDDINIKLGPRQAMDLDKIMGREKSGTSKDLRLKISKGIIDVRRKDVINPVKTIQAPVNNTADMNKMKEELLQEMRNQLKEVGMDIKEQINKNKQGISIEDITNAVRQVVASMPQASSQVVLQKVKEEFYGEADIDESLLADIHARAVNELTKETKVGHIDYKKAKSVDNIDNNVSELEELLGM